MNHLSRRYLLSGFLAIVLAGVVGTAVWTSLRLWPKQGGGDQRPLEGLENFAAVPEFSLVERSGRQVRLTDLRGKIWVANFIYTSCKDTCPLQSAEVSKLQEDFRYQRDLVLVSISVDPERDTPQVLSRYAERYHADPERWLFLTGNRGDIYQLAQKGFHLSTVPASAIRSESKEILHSSRLVLVDRSAQIRGYYNSGDADALKRLRRDLKVLLQG